MDNIVEQGALNATAGWEGIFNGITCQRLETVNLPNYLPKQRWFGGKSRHIKSTRVLDWTMLKSSHCVMALVEVEFDTGGSDVYLLLLAMAFSEAAEELQRTSANAIIAPVGDPGCCMTACSMTTPASNCSPSSRIKVSWRAVTDAFVARPASLFVTS